MFVYSLYKVKIVDCDHWLIGSYDSLEEATEAFNRHPDKHKTGEVSFYVEVSHPDSLQWFEDIQLN